MIEQVEGDIFAKLNSTQPYTYIFNILVLLGKCGYFFFSCNCYFLKKQKQNIACYKTLLDIVDGPFAYKFYI